MKIYVGNLPFSVTDDELRGMFESHGQVESANIISDRETGRSRGFGFVQMNNDDEATKAIEEMGNFEIGGRTLTVNKARPREERGGRGGGGGGRRGGYDGGGGGGGNRW